MLKWNLKYKVSFSRILLFSFLVQMCAPALAFAGEGPSKPEAAQFEPIDTSDLVNNFTGDFNYNIPLVEVPGPEGDWPLNLSYHGGIGPNREATFVGLGWTINPGAINRFLNGYPDDYWGGHVESYFYAAQQSGRNYSIGVSYGIANVAEVGASISYDTYSGKYGVNAFVGVGYFGNNVNAGVRFYAGTSGTGIAANLSVSASARSEGGTFGGSIGVGASWDSNSGGEVGAFANVGVYSGPNDSRPMASIGANYSSDGGLNVSGSIGGVGVGFQSQSSSSEGHFKRSGWSFSIPVWYGINVTLGYSKWKWWLDETYHENSFGTLHQAAFNRPHSSISSLWGADAGNIWDEAAHFSDYSEHPTMRPGSMSHVNRQTNKSDFYRSKKMDRMINDDLILSGGDNYSVSAQGLVGNFKPYLEYSYKLYNDEKPDNGNSTYSGKFATINNKTNTGKHVVFRMEGDPGANFVSLTPGGGVDYSKINEIQEGANKIYPAISPYTGLLMGFKVKSPDGRVYEFYQPVMNYYQYSANYVKRGTGEEKKQTTSMSTPYATSWLLTGIKGSDYVDRGTAGFSEDDWGFWVNFHYENSGQFVPWRTPHSGYAIGDEEDTETLSYGIRERLYVKSIETATHLADFKLSDRDDNFPVHIEKSTFGAIDIQSFAKRNETTYDSVRVLFPFPSSYISSLYANNNLELEYQYNTHTINGPDREWSTSVKRTVAVNAGNIENHEGVASIRLKEETKTPALYEGRFSDLTFKNVGSAILKLTPKPNAFSYNATNTLSSQTRTFTFPVSLTESRNNGVKDFILSVRTRELDFDPRYGEDKPRIHTHTITESNFTSVTEANGTTSITVSLGNRFVEEMMSATLKSRSNLIHFPKSAKKLDKLVVYKKVFNANKTMNYAATISSAQVEAIDFNYDYSLVKYSENSVATNKGKLTLKSLRRLGRNNVQSLPSTVFDYGFNPNHGRYRFSTFGTYNSLGTPNENQMSTEKTIADRDVAAWTLNQITLPLGAKTKIEFETDEIAYVGSYNSRLRPFIYYQKNLSPVSARSVRITNATALEKIKKNYDEGLKDVYIAKKSTYTGGGGGWKDPHDPPQHQHGPNPNSSASATMYQSTGYGGFFQISSIVNDYIYFSEDVFNTSYTYHISPPYLYEGGHRVKSVSVETLTDTKKTLYKYEGGSTTSLPEKLVKDYAKHYASTHRYNMMKPAPSVGYAAVEAIEVNPLTNEPLVGKVRTEFFTHRDFSTEVKLTSVNSDIDNLLIHDKSAIIGQAKSIETYGYYTPTKTFFPITKKQSLFAFSSDLLNNGEPINGDATDVKKKKAFNKSFASTISGTSQPLGLTQHKYQTENKAYEPEYDFGTKHSKNKLKRVEHRKEALFVVGMKNTLYHYDTSGNYSSPLTTKVTKNYTIGYDALSGKPLISETVTSRNDRSVIEKTPAYWKYAAMQDKNMLLQSAKSDSYIIPDQTAGESIDIYKNNTYHVASKVTTWKDWDSDASIAVWRKNDEFISTKNGASHVDFTSWTAFNNEESSPANGDFINGWKRMSNITNYDRYGHPTEERGINGQYTSSLYGYNDALPIAIVKNARLNKIKYFGFEELSGESKTGVGSKAYTGTIAELKTPNVSDTYKVSGWIKPTSTTTINGKTYSANGSWQYFEVTGVAQNTTLSVSGNGRIDDIRIHPTYSTMSTFTYDPLTLKVTSITDVNNISTYYEYDNAGRLIGVYDHNKYLLNSYEYNYGRGTN